MTPPSPSPPHYHAAHWVFPVGAAPIAHGFVALQGQTITAVGSLNELAPSLHSELLGTLPNHGTTFITPGLINTHTHLELTLPHIPTPIPINADESMGDWLNKVITHRQSSPHSPLEHCMAATQALLACGTTGVNDISTFGESFHALAACGLRGAVSMEWFWPLWDTPTPTAHPVRYWQHFASKASPLLTAGLSPHAPYNVSPTSWQAMVDTCQPGLLHTHAGESTDETHWLLGQPTPIGDVHKRFFGSPIGPQPLAANPQATSPYQYLRQHGCFTDTTRPIILAHGVTLTPDDWHHMSQHPHIGVSHCPRSNLWLHGHTLAANAPTDCLSLGTDSTLSNHTLDVRAEGRWCHQHHGWPLPTLLAMLTQHGAKQLGWQTRCGTLAPGKAADVVAWHTNATVGPRHHTPYQALAQWLAPTTQAQHVWINGQLRYQRPITTPT